MKVLFLQSAHYADDDRVEYHQRTALSEAGCEVDVCGKEELQGKDRFSTIAAKANDYQVIIADTPRALWAVRKAKHAKLIYDITEWYPSKKNLRGLCLLHNWAKAFLMCLASLWAGIHADAFVFGEHYKALPFRILFPYKQHIYIPYYPDLQYIDHTPPCNITHKCRLLYAGPLTEEKGYYRVLEAVKVAQEQCPDTHICLDIITNTPNEAHPSTQVEVNYLSYMPFNTFCKTISRYDLFLDLRDCDCENTHCLPIKLFYYLACGRPCIYSNLKAIRHHVLEYNSCISLANTTTEAAMAIVKYIQTPSLYYAHCQKAQELSGQQYNWNHIKSNFIQLITHCH